MLSFNQRVELSFSLFIPYCLCIYYYQDGRPLQQTMKGGHLIYTKQASTTRALRSIVSGKIKYFSRLQQWTTRIRISISRIQKKTFEKNVLQVYKTQLTKRIFQKIKYGGRRSHKDVYIQISTFDIIFEAVRQ